MMVLHRIPVPCLPLLMAAFIILGSIDLAISLRGHRVEDSSSLWSSFLAQRNAAPNMDFTGTRGFDIWEDPNLEDEEGEEGLLRKRRNGRGYIWRLLEKVNKMEDPAADWNTMERSGRSWRISPRSTGIDNDGLNAKQTADGRPVFNPTGW